MTTTNHDAAGSTVALATAGASQPPAPCTPAVSGAPYGIGTQHTARTLIQRGFTSARGVLRSTRLYEVAEVHVDVTTWAHPEHGRIYLAEVVS